MAHHHLGFMNALVLESNQVERLNFEMAFKR